MADEIFNDNSRINVKLNLIKKVKTYAPSCIRLSDFQISSSSHAVCSK